MSEETQSSAPWLGQRHRVAGPDCPLKDVLCSQTHSWDPPRGCAQCAFCTQMYSCICFARMTLLAVDRAVNRQCRTVRRALPELPSRPWDCARTSGPEALLCASGSSSLGSSPLTPCGELQDIPLHLPGLNSLVLGFEVRRTTNFHGMPRGSTIPRSPGTSGPLGSEGEVSTGVEMSWRPLTTLTGCYPPRSWLPPRSQGWLPSPTGLAAPHESRLYCLQLRILPHGGRGTATPDSQLS